MRMKLPACMAMVFLAALLVLAGCGGSDAAADPPRYFAYVANAGDNAIAVYSINAATGEFKATGAAVGTDISPDSIAADPSGRFVFAANRGANSVSAYAIDAATGALTAVGSPVTVGSSPMSIAIVKK